jgi:hypothetical protein
MPKCPNGHEQRLGLKCLTCGEPIAYRGALEEMRSLPKIDPNYGKVSVLAVGCPGLSLKADYVGEITTAQGDQRTWRAFQAATIRGGSWLDFQRKYLGELRRWMKLVGIDKSKDRVIVIDTTKPISVLALSALPSLTHTVVIAVTADHQSTPVEQNNSYTALSLALKKGLPVVALSQTFEREMMYFTEDRGFVTGIDALSRLLEPLIAAADDLMDLLEKDIRLGVRMHSLSTIVAQSYNASTGTGEEDCQTVHALVFSTRENEAEFSKGFGVFRNRKFKGALSAEVRFHETTSQLYDLLTICGLKDDSFLRPIAPGYEAIAKSVPELSVEGAS